MSSRILGGEDDAVLLFLDWTDSTVTGTILDLGRNSAVDRKPLAPSLQSAKIMRTAEVFAKPNVLILSSILLRSHLHEKAPMPLPCFILM
mmetsp:Transcript_27409/g.40207  ORF Transcript_27409/g.40207 Transcript_27409/m.40207 type:complete len:90 (-) Transcript_27409:85-354(-)